MPVYIEKSGDLVRCYYSGTDGRTTEQGKIELLSQWTMDGCDEQLHFWVICFNFPYLFIFLSPMIGVPYISLSFPLNLSQIS